MEDMTQTQVDAINEENERRWMERIKDERFERRMQATVWAARKTVKWAIIGAAGAFVYAKITDKSNDDNVNTEGSEN